MIYAYDQSLISKARLTLSWMLEYGINVYGIEPEEFFRRFVNSGIAHRIERGDVSCILGRSGAELAYEVVSYADPSIQMVGQIFSMNRSPEYWAGYVLAQFQWSRNVTFKRIGEIVSITQLISLYPKYHEMDTEHILMELDRIDIEKHRGSQLKRLRLYAGLSQSGLAKKTGIPVRTIQQYEQGQKDLSKAQAVYLLELSKVLSCEPSELIV